MEKKHIQIYPEKELYNFYKKITEEDDRSMNQVLLNALREYKKMKGGYTKKNEE